MLAELGHCDAAEGERWRVVAHADVLEGPERVADDEGARGGGDQGVHRDRLLRGAWPSLERREPTICFVNSMSDLFHTIDATTRFLSVDPLREDLGRIAFTGVHWVIVGCES